MSALRVSFDPGQCRAELKGVESSECMKAQQPSRERLHRLDVDDHGTGPDELPHAILRATRDFFLEGLFANKASKR